MKNSYLFFTLFTLLISIDLFSQTVVFNNNYGSNSEDVGFSSVVLPDGNYLTLGWTEGTANGLSDFYLVKNDPDGNVLWKKSYGNYDRESGLSLTISLTGGYILAGSGRSTGNGLSDCLIYKIDEEGNEIWSRTFGFATEDYLRSLHELPNGELLICGYTEYGNGGKNLLAAKLDAAGKAKWWESIGGSEAEEGWTVTADDSGNSYFGGWTQSTSNGNSDFLLIKKTSSGATVFIKTYGGNNVDSGLKLLFDSNRLIFAGSTHSYGNGRSDVLLLDLDLDGNQISQKTFGGPDHDYCRSICKTSDGYALTGFTRNFGAQGNDIFIAFTNDSLEVVNHSVIVEANDQEAWDIDDTGNNGFILTGKGIVPGESDNDMKLIKFDNYALSSNTEIQDNWQLKPNPAVSELTLTNVKPDSKIIIYNSLGQVISQLTWNESTIDISYLPNGIYYLCVELRNRVNAKKFIIAR